MIIINVREVDAFDPIGNLIQDKKLFIGSVQRNGVWFDSVISFNYRENVVDYMASVACYGNAAKNQMDNQLPSGFMD